MVGRLYLSYLLHVLEAENKDEILRGNVQVLKVHLKFDDLGIKSDLQRGLISLGVENRQFSLALILFDLGGACP